VVSDQDGVDVELAPAGLFDVDELLEARTPGRLGQYERMLQEAVKAATAAGKLGAVDLGMLGGALAGARSLDVAMALPSIKGGYLVAQLLTPYREVLQALGLPAPPDPGESQPAPVGQQDQTHWLSDHFGTAE
jgi:hypothetical protein